MSNEDKIVKSTGNVFEDIGFDKSEAETLQLRARLMFNLATQLRAQKKTQKELGKILGIGQSRVSDLIKGKAELFSLDMLVILANRFGSSVTVSVAPAAAATPAVRASQRAPSIHADVAPRNLLVRRAVEANPARYLRQPYAGSLWVAGTGYGVLFRPTVDGTNNAQFVAVRTAQRADSKGRDMRHFVAPTDSAPSSIPVRSEAMRKQLLESHAT